MMRITMQVSLHARTRSLVIAKCTQYEPRRGSVVISTYSGSVDKYWRHRNKKHKKQPFSDASASHLSLVLWHV